MNKAVFLDRDGVINIDRPDYVYKASHYQLVDHVSESLEKLKMANYKLIVITNQSGIAKKLYGHEDVKIVHDLIQQDCNFLIDDFYYAPWHPEISESLTRKPGTLMFERAIAKYKIDPIASWMIGDRDRDLAPARKLGMQTILLGDSMTESADYATPDIREAVKKILIAENP